MKINKYTDTMSEQDSAQYLSALKDSSEALIISEAPHPPRKIRRRKKRSR